ncbi:MAG: undecaprenyl/decaprenyl-phosphate alpha-N-acetylglucosaminyl 1-phosphate transferase, partial [Candidatus Eremiobacteraeota bacterium]|nr:undecaprenyl/decaprenyl-phosphate alpha-N-acetylglucosaminyl 1-phosphate transferase [Candidatus Eremiobacteraeota bacterium]
MSSARDIFFREFLNFKDLFWVYPVAFFLALALVLLLTPLVIRLAIKTGALDQPDSRKVHTRPIPRLGGTAIFFSFFTILFGILAYLKFIKGIELKGIENLTAIFISSSILFTIGLIDDFKGLTPRAKLAFQVIAALILIQQGIGITFLRQPSGGLVYLPAWLAIVLSLLWLVIVTNALNLMDGLDGLLAGISVITGFIFLVASVIKGQVLVALMMAIIMGTCLGFLKYNFNPARIFMGDSGSLFLGLLFATVAVMGGLKSTATISLIFPVLIMAVPLLDTTLAIFRRIKKRRPIFQADKEHIHHQLLSHGWSQAGAVLLIYIV